MASESASTTTGAGSTSALTIREIIPTNRTPEVWKDFNMCIMTNGHKKSTMQGAADSYPEAGQTSMGRDGQIFMFNPDYLREQFAGLVIQRGLPFNHFDHEQTTRVFQNTMQPRYTHVSRSTLKRVPKNYARLLHGLNQHKKKKSRGDPTMSFEYEQYLKTDFVSGLQPKDFASYDVLGFWKSKENQFPVLSAMALDYLSVQASSGRLSESAFSTRVDAQERKQNSSPLELPLDVEEGDNNVSDDMMSSGAKMTKPGGGSMSTWLHFY
ncbi:zinc finger BED domain-containing protein RICESLEEPER 2 [Tanacetum coccineum]